MKKFIFVALVTIGLFIGCFAGMANGMPPHPDSLQDTVVLQQAYVASHRSLINSDLNAPGINPFVKIVRGGVNPSSAPVAGGNDFNFLIVCVDFEDNQAQTPIEFFDSLVFANDTGTVKDFFRDMSNGTIQFTTPHMPSEIGWIRLPETYSYYVNDNYGFSNYPNNTKKMTEDVIDALDSLIDFSDFDNNGDGYVDGIAIIHAGTGAELSGKTYHIWSHKWQIEPQVRDGVTCLHFNTQPELWWQPGDMTIGVIVHEAGHLFGLIDYYDTDGSSYGTGRWDVMAVGSWNGGMGRVPAPFSAHAKLLLGFDTAIDLSGNTETIIVRPGEIYRVSANNKENSRQFYLLELRKTGYYNRHVPAHGVLVEAVDLDMWSNAQERCQDRISRADLWPKLRIIQPDGLCQLEKHESTGNSGDILPSSSATKLTATISAWPSPVSPYFEETGFAIDTSYWDTDTSVVLSLKACDCPHHADMNGDGVLTIEDVHLALNIAFKGHGDIVDPKCPYSRADTNLDGVVNAFDVVILIQTVFHNNPLIQYPCPENFYLNWGNAKPFQSLHPLLYIEKKEDY